MKQGNLKKKHAEDEISKQIHAEANRQHKKVDWENAQCNYGIIQLPLFTLSRAHKQHTQTDTRHSLLSQCELSSKLAVVWLVVWK